MPKYMKPIIIFTSSVCMGAAIFIVGYLYTSLYKNEQVRVSPLIFTQFSIETPPSQSQKGEITSLSGSVLWQSRTATEAAKIITQQKVQQGEQITTGDTGEVVIRFDQLAEATLSPKSQISFIQTLPHLLVFAQNLGDVVYKNETSDALSVRVLHLLLEEQTGEMTVSINPLRPVVTVTVTKGIVRAAFNDLYYNSSVVTISEGHIFYFNDETRRTDSE